MGRKLASIQRIKDLSPIPGADRIELAKIQGWDVVVQKGLYEVGDLCVYFEIDSILPPRSWCEFMASRKYRVKTIRLRKQISQGLAIPLSDVDDLSYMELKEGADVTSLVGVKKHDPQSDRERKAYSQSKRNPPPHKWMLRFSWGRKIHQILYPRSKGSWPEWFPKTDEVRIQNISDISTHVAGRELYVTEKLDGQSVTMFYHRTQKVGLFSRGLFGVCSRNIWYKTPIENNWWGVTESLGVQEKLENYCNFHKRSLAIQGEIIGPSIQGNHYDRKDREVYFFNVWDIERGCYLNLEEKIEVLGDLRLDYVPILKDSFKPNGLSWETKGYLEGAEGESVINRYTEREGLVFRDKEDDSFSFKAISNKYLLKGK